MTHPILLLVGAVFIIAIGAYLMTRGEVPSTKVPEGATVFREGDLPSRFQIGYHVVYTGDEVPGTRREVSAVRFTKSKVLYDLTATEFPGLLVNVDSCDVLPY